MDKRTNTILGEYISAISEINLHLVKVYLFGSYAKNTNRPDSDIDIAFIIDNLSDEERFDLQVQLIMIAADFDLRIEPHPISTLDFNSENPFAVEIQRTGIAIKPQSPNSWFN